MVSDFFGIFFTLSWVFYTDQGVYGDFLGYFSVLGEIWLWKFAIATMVPVAVGLVVFFGAGYWVMYLAMLCDPNFMSHSGEKRCGWSCLWIIFGVC